MGRIIFWILLFAFIAISWMISRRRSSLTNEERVELEVLRREAKNRGRSRELGEPMSKCEYCGMYFPAREAVRRRGRVYCSGRCRDAAGE